jgi:hypothetical protein
MKLRLISAILACALLTNCATIHRHPKATAIVVGAGVGIGVGLVVGYRKGCPSHVDGYPYDGTPPCPSWCGKDGCYWPTKK